MTSLSPATPGGWGELPAHVVASELDLQAAWTRVHEKRGMPGVDGTSVSRFAREADDQIRTLAARLASGQYRPAPLRLAALPKRSGDLRFLMVPTVVDRVAQAAVAQWLARHWNPQFDAASFAYRPGLGVHDALRRVAELRDAGFRWVLDADLRAFFDSIDHERLLDAAARSLGPGSPLLAWIRNWLIGPVWDGARLRRVRAGVPQGSPLSPLLANFFLDEFDRTLRAAGMKLVRYADDFLVLARSPFDLAAWRRPIEEALGSLGLSLHHDKTRVTTFSRGLRFLGADLLADRILIPFEPVRPKPRPVYVAPVMPRALLRAWFAGRLDPRRPFDGELPLRARPNPSGAASASSAVGEWCPDRVALRRLSRGLP